MKPKSHLNTTLNPSSSLNIRSLASPVHKKVEGFDRTTSSQLFSSKVTKLKNKPKVDSLEEQYISGLQDEIKYLQMELKLLQEKDQERHGQIDQLQKFFGDGIPINENILAIKNGFNNYKNSNEKKAEVLGVQKVERSNLISELANKVEQLSCQLATQQKDNKSAEAKQKQEMFQLVYQESALRKNLEKEEQELKAVKLQSRKLGQTLEKLTRNKLINNIVVIKHENNKHTKLNQLKITLKETQEELEKKQKQLAELKKCQEDKAYLLTLEEQNLGQKKKIIGLERDHDNLKTKLKEKDMELDQKLKERLVEINHKNDIQRKVQDLKQQINIQNSLTVEAVTEITRARQIERIKKIVDTNQVLSKHIDHYSTILTQLENNIEALAQRKPQAKTQLQVYGNELVKLQNRMKHEKERQVNLHAELVMVDQQSSDVKASVTPLQEKSRKKGDQISAYLEERRRLLEEIKVKEKQLQLIFILKNLNFEEAEIAKNSNNSIQEELTSFLKNWQKLQRNS